MGKLRGVTSAVLLGSLFLLTAGLRPAHAQPLCSVWDLAADFRNAPNQANPNPDCSNQLVWYFLQSSTLAHDPTTYRLLPEFVPDSFFIPGLPGWQGALISTSVNDKLPSVRLNASGALQTPYGMAWPPGVINVHPGPGLLVIVGWRSPMTGPVSISGSVTSLRTGCGEGIVWSVDRGPTTLASGSILPGGQQDFATGVNGAALAQVSVQQGDFLYFIVGPKATHYCDSTALVAKITPIPHDPPTTTATLSPAPNAAGWNNKPVTVTLSSTENGNAALVKQITYSASGAWSAPSTTVAGATASLLINTEGVTTITYWGTGFDNNSEAPQARRVQIDWTAPTVTFSGNAGTYTVDQMVNIACTATDSLSGVASSTCRTISGPAYAFNLGSNTFSASAADVAGNTGIGSTSFTVQVTSDSLANLTQRFESKKGVAHALIVKLQHGQLGAYMHQVTAESGKSLTTDQGAVLLRLATAMGGTATEERDHDRDADHEKADRDDHGKPVREGAPKEDGAD